MDTQRSTIRVAVVEDEPLFRSMMATVLESRDDIRVAWTAGSATQARAAATPGTVDVAIIDIGLPDDSGLSLGVELRRWDRSLRVLLLSAHNQMDLIAGLPDDVRHGWSYLSKTASADVPTLIAAVRATARGSIVLDPTLVRVSAPRRGTPLANLTARQYEVLQHLAQGLSNAAIAERLGIAERSVHNHLTAIYATLGIESEGISPRVAAVLKLIGESHRP